VTHLVDFDDVDVEAFSADLQRRTITGVVVPWGKIGRHRNGNTWRFARGSLQYGNVKYIRLNDEHDQSQRIGRGTFAEDTDEGLVVTFKIFAGPAGDRALRRAAHGERNGLSVEVEMDVVDAQPDPSDPTVTLVMMANFTGVGLVRSPAFPDARLIKVVASSDPEGTGMDPEDTTAQDATADPAAATTTTTEPAAAAPQMVTFTADQFTALMAGLPGNQPAGNVRPVVDPTRGGNPGAAVVTEPLPYTFSVHGEKTVFAPDAKYDFSTDIMEIARAAERKTAPHPDAVGRVNEMISAYFADVETADVTAINPNRHRPDMWVRQRDYRKVLWDMVAAGSTDGSKFDVPKFTSAAGLVVPATEKTEPASGSFVAELQTITPTQVWGKVEITRQAWRAGGNPALSGILWDQMLREYFEDREAAVATFLATLTAASDITLTGTPLTTPDNDDDQVTVNELEAAIAMLQFDRGGDQISAFAVHRDLFKVLARVTDDSGRKLYPLLGPANASGTAQARWRTINIAGVTAVGSYALGASGTASTNSWLFDPATVYGWASAPERMFWDFGATVQTANIPQLSFVTLGIYGDIAFANTDITGVRQVVFDPSV
jgi:phage head maturation protease